MSQKKSENDGNLENIYDTEISYTASKGNKLKIIIEIDKTNKNVYTVSFDQDIQVKAESGNQNSDECNLLRTHLIKMKQNLDKFISENQNLGNQNSEVGEYDFVLLLYFLHAEKSHQQKYNEFYKTMIKKLTNIFEKMPKLEAISKFSTKFCYETWKKFLNWLNDIEPSAIFSYFLCLYYNYLSQKNNLEKIQGDIENRIIKTPSLYFTPYFLKKMPEYEYKIIKIYTEHMNNLPIKIDLILLSIFPFFSPNKYESKKTIRSTRIYERIIQNRLHQSSYVSNFVIECFENLIHVIFPNLFPNDLDIYFKNYQRDSLALETQSEDQLNNNEIKEYIDPEQNDQILYYGLPDSISIQTNQDYYNFYNKNVFTNYPLELTGNSKLKFQIQKIINHFKLNIQDEDNIKFMIIKEKTFENLFDSEKKLFPYFIKKYVNYAVPIQHETDEHEDRIIKMYKAILDFNECLKFYKGPLLLSKFIESITKEKNTNDENNVDENNVDENNDDENSVDENNDDDDDDGEKPMGRSKSQVIKPTGERTDGEDESENNKKKRRSTKVQVQQNNDFHSISTFSKIFPHSFSRLNIQNSHPNKVLVFISKRNDPYFFIDSISKFIIDQFGRFIQSFKSQPFAKEMNINSIKDKILSISKVSQSDRNDIHIQNVIKISLFAYLNYKFDLIGSDIDFKYFSPSHLFFMFAFYRLQKIKKDQQKKTILPKKKIYDMGRYIQNMSEPRIELLTRLYIYSTLKLHYFPNDNIPINEHNSFYIKPHPSIKIILDQFIKVVST